MDFSCCTLFKWKSIWPSSLAILASQAPGLSHFIEEANRRNSVYFLLVLGGDHKMEGHIAPENGNQSSPLSLNPQTDDQPLTGPKVEKLISLSEAEATLH
ncbi:hypothetical protein HAX54_026289 [Datura stramonium]|uniref:Uncharacterized protein n=1 Tax=Datura stramonium TaxID=4076 RepID=A0ABS8V0W0_DATST|nr:hypothetical protein [Datura stramonium]